MEQSRAHDPSATGGQPARDRRIERVVSQVGAFEALVPHRDVRAPTVSQWSVGMHIHHCALAMRLVATEVLRCETPPPRWSANPVRTLILLTGRVPRGRAEAPAAVRPSVDLSEGLLGPALSEAAQLVRRLPDAPQEAWFRHFALGVIRRRSVPRFLEVHNRHHLRIISDILAG
jgi:hypothetical protein